MSPRGTLPAFAALLLAAWLLATVAVYVPAIGGPYQFDDHVGVAVDPGARDAMAWWHGIRRHVRPVLKASFVVTAATGEALSWPAAEAHRIGNLALHLATVVLAYALVLALGRRFAPDWPAGTAGDHALALAAAATLALHPLATEAVSYVSGRSASLATGLSLLALLAWLRVRPSAGASATAWFALGTLAWLAAVGTREAALLVPLAWWLVEQLTPGRGAGPGPGTMRRWWIVLGALALVIAWIALVVHARYAPLLQLSMQIAEAQHARPTWAAAFTHLACVAVFACRPSIDPQPEVTGWAGALPVLALLVAATVLAWRCRHRAPLVTVALAWAALWLLPTYALPIRHDVVAERHAYPVLWSLGLLAAVAVRMALDRVTGAQPVRRVGLLALLAAATVATMATLTWQRNRDWQSETALWDATLRDARVPTPRILNNLGYAYLEAGRWADARRVLAQAERLAPDDPSVAVNLERARRRSMN